MGEKIPVTVLAGLPGSGKTTLLNRLLDTANTAGAARIALVISDIGEAELEHPFAKHISDRLVLGEYGCLCCNVRGELVDALRELFMAALRRQIPAFSRVLVETARDPASILYTLQNEFFLRERYRYDGCISVVDSISGSRQLDLSAQAMQQVALADALVLGKADIADADSLRITLDRLGDINATASRYFAKNPAAGGKTPILENLPLMDDLVRLCSSHLAERADIRLPGHGASLWSGERNVLRR